MKPQIEKWMGYYSPLHRGRFDFFTSLDPARWDAFHHGLVLTGGRFWTRVLGGHDLRRTLGPAPQWRPAETDALVGRSDGRTTAVTTFPWVGHAADTRYVYALTVRGAGGVADTADAPRVRACFDAAGALEAPAPNAPGPIAIETISGGRFLLRWTYDEADQEAAPSVFKVYNDAASPGTVDFTSPVASVAYRTRQGYFDWTSAAFDDGTRVLWSVLAESSGGAAGPATAPAFGVAAAAQPDPPQTVLVSGVQ